MNRRLFTPFFMMLCSLLFLPQAGMAQDSTLFFVETFDAVTPPALPAGWSDTTLAWETSSSVASTGSGGNNAKITGTAAGTLISAPADLSGMTAGSLLYLARRTSSYAQEAMRVLATLDGGQSFITVLDDGAALPLDDGSYAEVEVELPAAVLGQSGVQFAFEAIGGTTSGANVRIDDVTVMGSGMPQDEESLVGFAAEASTANSMGVFEVPVFLDFENVTALQGLQFDISWATGAFTLTNILRGTAIADTSQWSINAASRDGEMRAVLLGNSSGGLSSGLYDPLFTLVFAVDAGNTTDTATLLLERVLGALSVQTGEDAGLVTGLATHTVTLTTGSPTFTPDASILDVGTVTVDSSASVALLVTNTGTAPLVIDSVAVDNPLYGVDVPAATIEVGASRSFNLSFFPTALAFGLQAGQFTFYHNAGSGSDVIEVTGIGTGGRGDASNDGVVDASDLILGIDAVLERVVLATSEQTSIDLYPFGSPDGLLDVRDLTVVSQAILLGTWPDAVPLPAAKAIDGTHSKDGASVQVALQTVQGITTLYLQSAVPLRAFQLAVGGAWNTMPATNSYALENAGASLQVVERAADINVLGVRYDGGTIAPGKYALLTYPAGQDVELDKLGYAVAVAAEGERLPVKMEVEGVDTEAAPELPAEVTLAQPYPNPFHRAQHAGLSIPFTLASPQQVLVQVYDLLGRPVITLVDEFLAAGVHNVAWNGKVGYAEVPAAGIYVLKIQAGQKQVSRTIVMY
ncbi:MAG: T9SS type A sorting domain-containing protein [Bacteroidota bacterium]